MIVSSQWEELDQIWEDLQHHIDKFETREGQIDMSLGVLKALQDGGHFVVEAGTGTGKSLAYLLPAVQLAQDEFRMVISTATIALQEQLLQKDIPLVEKIIGRTLRVEVIKGRSNYLCKQKFNQHFGQTSFVNSIQERELIEWVNETETGDRNELQTMPEIWEKVCSQSESCLAMRCQFYSECFVVKLRKRAETAELLVTNHHLYFSDLNLRIDSDGSMSIFPDYEGVIFDEAHHIPDTATKSLGREVKYSRVIKLFKEVTSYLKQKFQAQVNLVQEAEASAVKAFNKLSDFRESDYLLRELDSFISLKEFRKKLSKLAQHVEECALEEMDRPEQPRMLASRLNKTKLDLDLILDLEEEDYISWVNQQSSDISLSTNPVFVHKQLREFLFDNVDRIIMTSATLSINGKFAYFKNRVGLSQDAQTYQIESPFNYQEQSNIYIPKNFPEPRSGEYNRQLADTIEQIIDAAGGRTLVLFTSYSTLNSIYNQLKDKVPYEIYCQGIHPKNKILSWFQNDASSVLMATNSFREGVDVPGSSLQVVIMDKLPFAVPDNPLIKAKIEKLQQEGQNSFMNYQLPEAVLAVKQGFGRLIRHNNDCGIFALLDPRVFTKSYGRHFINSLPNAPLISNWSELEAKIKTLP